VKIEYRVLMGGTFTDPAAQVVDTIDWADLDVPHFETGRARPIVEAFTAIHGAKQARAILGGGWSNGYTSTRAVEDSSTAL
jgi:hypothetical protein